MLRECRRVLREGGRMASVVIEPAPGLDPDALAQARRLGPSSLTTHGDLVRNTLAVGLSIVSVEDWTGELAALLRVTLRHLSEHEEALRTGEGDDVYEREAGKKRALLQGVEEELLVRTLVVAVR